MSYDIDLMIDTGTGELHTICDVGNYTSNVSAMWCKALGGFTLSSLNGRIAGECVAMLETAVEHMRNNPDDYTPMNPRNGWGNYDGATDYLCMLLNACKKHPKTTIIVSA